MARAASLFSASSVAGFKEELIPRSVVAGVVSKGERLSSLRRASVYCQKPSVRLSQ